MDGILPYALGAAFVAALATNLMVPPVTRLAVALRALDHPGERRQQVGAVPRLGGIAIALGILLGIAVAAAVRWDRWGAGVGKEELMALVLGAGLVFLVGVTNAINLIDGLDGLAGGVVTIISVSFLGYSILQGNPGTVILMAAIAGSSVGFLRHNWEPARIFMGDSGSLTLGFLLAATSVHSSLKAPAAVAILVPILALGVPVMDTLLVMVVRFLDRPKGPVTGRFLRMFHADRNHLHHLLAHFGGDRSRIVAVIYAVVVSFCALALVVAVTGQTTLGVALVALEFSVILAMRQAGLAIQARRLSRLQREEIKSEVLGRAEGQPATVRRIAS